MHSYPILQMMQLSWSIVIKTTVIDLPAVLKSTPVELLKQFLAAQCLANVRATRIESDHAPSRTIWNYLIRVFTVFMR